MTSLSLIKSFQGHASYVNRIKQLPNGFVATCSDDNLVKIWNSFNWSLIQTYTKHNANVKGLDFINNDTIVSGDENGVINIWYICTGMTNRTIKARGAVWSLVLLSNGFYLASGLSNQNISIYQTCAASHKVKSSQSHDFDFSYSKNKKFAYKIVKTLSKLIKFDSNISPLFRHPQKPS